MRKNNMRTPKEKEKILKEFYVGKIGRNEICRKYNISTQTLSSWRSKYDRDSDSSKIAKQKTVLPIFEWTDFDVWLYILTKGIDFNQAYRLGYSRVGCWCCPNNSDWSAFLSSIYMNEEFNAFKSTLYKFAKKVGKEDWKEYIDTGKW